MPPFSVAKGKPCSSWMWPKGPHPDLSSQHRRTAPRGQSPFAFPPIKYWRGPNSYPKLMDIAPHLAISYVGRVLPAPPIIFLFVPLPHSDRSNPRSNTQKSFGPSAFLHLLPRHEWRTHFFTRQLWPGENMSRFLTTLVK